MKPRAALQRAAFFRLTSSPPVSYHCFAVKKDKKTPYGAGGLARARKERPMSAQDLELTPARTSALTGKKTKTLSNERWLGIGIPFIKRGQKIRYLASSVRAWIRENRREFRSTGEAKAFSRQTRRRRAA
jgi:hypothetical protein